MTRDEVKSQYAILSRDLASAHRQLAMVLGQAKDTRVKGYWDPLIQGESHSAKERFADGRALTLDIEVTRLRGEIAALEVEAAHARFVLDDWME